MTSRVTEILAVALLCLAVLGLVHQHLFRSEAWFTFRELFTHEALIACCVVGAIALVVGKYLGKKGL